jgi:hypothetical protein
MADNEEVVETEAPAPAEYDGGRDISSVLEAAGKDTPPADTPPVEAPAPTTVADTQAAVARAWKVYKDDVELKDLDLTKMTAAEFLAHKFGYNANGKEQRRDFEGLVRNAQQGHYNADKTVRIEQEREHALREWKASAEKVESYEAQRKVLNHALVAATRGNFEPLQEIVARFQKALDDDITPRAPESAPEGYVSRAELEANQRGEQVYNQQILPEAEKLGKQFGFSTEQVATAIMRMVDSYPSEFLTQEVLNSIMQQELPEMLTTLREKHPIPVPEVSAEAKRVAELEAKLAELTGKKVEAENKKVADIHERKKVAPPGVPTVGGGGELESPNFEDAAGARGWLRGLK